MKNIYLLGDSNASTLMMSLLETQRSLGFISATYKDNNFIHIQDFGKTTWKTDFTLNKFDSVKSADKNNSLLVFFYGTADIAVGIAKSTTMSEVVENYINKVTDAFAGFDVLFIEPVKQPHPDFLPPRLRSPRRITHQQTLDLNNLFMENLINKCTEKGLRQPLAISPILESIDEEGNIRLEPQVDSTLFNPPDIYANCFLHLNPSTCLKIIDNLIEHIS
jgi:hypothetical protein